MAEWAPPAQLLPKLDQIKSNLRRWSPDEWFIFWVLVPAFLLVVYHLPQSLKDGQFILDTVDPWKIQAWLLSSYTHSELYPHLLGNLAFYLVVLLMIFAFENNRKRFWLLAGWSFLAVPFLASLLTILFWDFIGRNTTGQGFSAVTGALLAYAMFIFIVWGLGERLVVFDHPELFTESRVPEGAGIVQGGKGTLWTGSRARYLVAKALLAVILALIVVMGLQTGVFMDLGGQVSNGIAHFGGFITALVLLLLFDLKYEERRYFDTMLAAAIVVGIFWYGYYLARLAKVVTAG